MAGADTELLRDAHGVLQEVIDCLEAKAAIEAVRQASARFGFAFLCFILSSAKNLIGTPTTRRQASLR